MRSMCFVQILIINQINGLQILRENGASSEDMNIMKLMCLTSAETKKNLIYT